MGSETIFCNDSINLMMVRAFVLLTIIVGLWAGRNVKTLKDYALANREFGIGVLTMTFLATKIHGNNIIIHPSYFSKNGLVQLMPEFGAALSLIIFGLMIAPSLVHFRKSITIGDVTEDLYGRSAKIVVGIAGTLFGIALVALQVVIIGRVGESLLGIPKVRGMLIGGLLIALYSTRGGVRSVALTDVLQFIALVVLVSVMCNVTVSEAGGLKTLFKNLHHHYPQKISLTSHPLFRTKVLIGIFNAFGIFLLNPHFSQRMLMASSERKVKKMFFTSAGFIIVLNVIMMLIGFSSLFLISPTSDATLIPTLIYNYFPVGIQGLLIVGVFAVIMSTMDSCLNGCGITFTHDIIETICKANQITFNELKVIRVITFAIGVLGIGAGILVDSTGFALGKILWYANAMLSAVYFPLVAGIKGLKADKRSFYLAFCSSFLLLLPLKLLNKITFETTLLSMLVNALVFFTSHYLINGGFVTVQRSNGLHKTWKPTWEGLSSWLGKYFPTPSNIARYSEYQVVRHGEHALAFSIFLSISYMLPHVLSNKQHAFLFNHILIIRSIGVALCAGLMIKTLWSKTLQRKLFPLYWHLSLLYCLPFSTTLIFLLGAGSTNWVADIGLAILLLIVLVDWLTFLIISGLGITGALLTFYLLKGHLPMIPDFDTAYYLIITCISTTIVGLIFARRKEIYAAIRFKTITSLARFIGHEVSYLSNYTLTPSQQIQRLIKEHSKKLFPGKTGDTFSLLNSNKETDSSNTSAVGYYIETEAIHQMDKEAQKIEQATRTMVETSKQLASIIQQFSQSIHNPQPILMKSLVQEVIDTFPGEKEQRTKISSSINEDFMATVPKRALIFVIHNLIRNAFIHGGKEDINVHISLENGNRLCVSDNGKGVPAENLEKIFVMFFTTGHPEFSSGIGLGFAKMVIEWMNAKIWCESSQEEGRSYSKFIIEFQLVPNGEETNN